MTTSTTTAAATLPSVYQKKNTSFGWYIYIYTNDIYIYVHIYIFTYILRDQKWTDMPICVYTYGKDCVFLFCMAGGGAVATDDIHIELIWPYTYEDTYVCDKYHQVYKHQRSKYVFEVCI